MGSQLQAARDSSPQREEPRREGPGEDPPDVRLRPLILALPLPQKARVYEKGSCQNLKQEMIVLRGSPKRCRKNLWLSGWAGGKVQPLSAVLEEGRAFGTLSEESYLS